MNRFEPAKMEASQRPICDGNIKKPILSAVGLRKSFGGHIVFDKISFKLYRGEVVLLRGDNGSGKTTLLNILTGNIEPDAGEVRLSINSVQEAFQFPKRWWQRLNPFDHFSPERMANSGVGRSWQDIRLFPSHDLCDNIAVATPGQVGENPANVIFRRSNVQKQEKKIRSDVNSMLMGLGLQGRENSYADSISLGQSKRVAILRTLKSRAGILFLDEPMSGLDESGISEVMDFLRKIVQYDQLTLVIVEHAFNIPRIIDMATTVWTLERGRLTINYASELREQTDILGDSDTSGWLLGLMGKKAKITKKQLPEGAILAIADSAYAGRDENGLELNNVQIDRGKRLVIGEKANNGDCFGLTFHLQIGQLAVLQAPNGWGKTTLLEGISGTIQIKQGTIKLDGQGIEHLPPWERAKLGVSFLQARNHTFAGLTVKESLKLSGIQKIPENIAHLVERRSSDLSGGEKQKVAMACVMNKLENRILLLDEPFSALDPTAISYLCHTIKKRLKDSCVIITLPGKSF